jgi:transcriptional regulator with GAF, ATPase, and Fis domain
VEPAGRRSRGPSTSAPPAVRARLSDEVGELPPIIQGKLLGLLQDRTYRRVGGTALRRANVRFVCATHRNLERDVAEGRFRQDLYYRLRVVELALPPLRARGAEDLDRLIDHFLSRFGTLHGRGTLQLSGLAKARLHRHAWPGSVRELEHVLESAAVLSGGSAQMAPLSSSPDP